MITTRRYVIIVFTVVALIIVLIAVNTLDNSQKGSSDSPLLSAFNVESIKISNISGFVYVASTQSQQMQGFQNVTGFGDCNGHGNCIGMLFAFSGDQNLCFWMYNTKIPLEQVWISESGSVVAVYEAQAENDNSVCHTGAYVLETSPTAKISVGDKFSVTS